MASEKKMYQVIKLLLYILLNSARGGLRFGQRHSLQVAISPAGGKIPRYTSGEPAPGRNFPSKTRNYFGNKLSGTLGSFFFFLSSRRFDDVSATRRH